MKILKHQRFIQKGPRIGIDYAKAADRFAARRFWVDEKNLRRLIKKPQEVS